MDIQSALKDGYSKEEIMTELGNRTGMNYHQAIKDGHPIEDVLAELNRRDIGGKKEEIRTGKTIPQRILGTVSNIPQSAYETGKGIVSAVTHPIETVRGIGALGAGGIELGVRAIAPSLIPEERRAIFSPEEISFQKGIIEPIKGAIRDPSQIAEYLEKDPIGAAMNVSGGLGAIGRVSKVGAISQAAELVNPITQASRLAAGGMNIVAKSRLPESIMGRTMKIPPAGLRDVERDRVLKTITREEKLPLGRWTAEKMTKMVGEIDNDISKTLSDLTQKGAKEIDINIITTKLDDLKQSYKNRSNPQQYYDAIDSVKQNYLTHSFTNLVGAQASGGTVTYKGGINLSQAHELKKGAYQEIQDYYMKRQRPETGRVGIQNQAEARAEATVAASLREAILSHPDVPRELRTKLSKEAGLMNARKWVERAVNRGENLDIISLSGMVFGLAVSSHMPATLAWRVSMSQPVMSRLAIALGKTRGAFAAYKTTIPYVAGELGRTGEQ